MVARVQAADGVGVAGTTVTFAASGGGTVTPASAVSDASGNVSTQWRLGPTVGTQTLTVTAAGLTGAPLTVDALARAVTPTKLVIGTQPANGTAGVALAAVTVAAQDADGNVVTPFTGDVSVALGTNPGSATLSGTTTVKAVAGVATFSDLKVNRPGTGYTLVFSSAPLTAATSSAFNVVAGTADQLAFTGVPSVAEAGVTVTQPVTVAVQDAAGNAVTGFTGEVTLALDANASPAGAALTGTLTRNAVAGVATFNDLKFQEDARADARASGRSLRAARAARALVESARPMRRIGQLSANSVLFTNPGYTQSRFNTLRLDHTNDASLVFASSVYAERAEAVGMTSWRGVYGRGTKLYVKDADLFKLSFDSLAVQIDASGAITRFDSLSFGSQDRTVNQLTLNLPTGFNKTFANLQFGTQPSTGRYLAATTPGTATVNMQNPSPGSHGGFVSIGAGVTLTGWQATRAYATTGASSTWNDPAAWSPSGVPSRYDDISILAGHSMSADNANGVRNVSLTPTSTLMLGYTNLSVFGNWTADTLSTLSAMSGGLDFYGNANISGRIGTARFHAPATVQGLTVANSIAIYAGGFNVNGQMAIVHGPFTTDSAGYLRMVSAGGFLQVDGTAEFQGASTYTHLTDGTLRLGGSFTQGGDPAAFAATASHRTILTGESFSGELTFTNPGASGTDSHFSILQLGDSGSRTITVHSDVYAVRTLERGTAAMGLMRGGGYAPTQAPVIHAASVVSSALLTMNATLLRIYEATNATSLSYATFVNTNIVGKDALTVESALATPVTPTISNLTFPMPVDTTSFRFVVANYLGSGGSLTLNLIGMSPINSVAVPSRIYASAGASINWTP
ncbi:MAG: hypothetical protein FJ363_05290 [Gemmatimonadetes bacterium]|nr:hypothetical protein [Gemmatimonadota bacterium]